MSENQIILDKLNNDLFLYKVMVENSRTGIAVGDASREDLPIIYVNPMFEEITGYTNEEFVGKNCRVLQNDDNDQEGIRVLKESIKNEKACRVEIRNYKKNGELFWNQITVNPIFDSEGKLIYYVGILNDITETVMLNEKLKNANDNLEHRIIEATKELIDINDIHNETQKIAKICNIKIDLESDVNWYSEQFYSMWGIEKNSNCNFETIIKTLDKNDKEKLEELIANSKNYSNNEFNKFYIDFKIFTFDGQEKYINGFFSTKFNTLNKPVELIGIMQDITEKVNDDKRKKEQELMLIQQSKLATMGEMIGNIAHQWRQPLTSLSLEKNILIDNYYDNELTDEIIEDYDVKVDEKLKYLSQTIDDFRNYFKPSKNKERFNLIDIINDAIKIVNTQLKHQNIELQFDKFNEEILLNGYPNEFKQVLINLINNSKDAVLKYQELVNEKGLIKVGVDKSSEDGYIDISVGDNGGGIPEDVMEKIFEPYFTTKFKSQGTGLGLYMSKIIVETNMKGKIRVQNTNEGALFVISLKEDK